MPRLSCYRRRKAHLIPRISTPEHPAHQPGLFPTLCHYHEPSPQTRCPVLSKMAKNGYWSCELCHKLGLQICSVNGWPYMFKLKFLSNLSVLMPKYEFLRNMFSSITESICDDRLVSTNRPPISNRDWWGVTIYLIGVVDAKNHATQMTSLHWMAIIISKIQTISYIDGRCIDVEPTILSILLSPTRKTFSGITRGEEFTLKPSASFPPPRANTASQADWTLDQ